MDARGRQTLFMVLTLVLCLAVLAAGVVLSIGYFTQGRNLRAVDMRKYAKVEMEDEVYTVSVDADAIVRDFHLPNPKNTTLDLDRYPDVETVYSLTFLVTPRAEGGWLIQTGSDRATAAADLRKGGLKLANTEWTWTEQDMKNAYRAGLEYPRKPGRAFWASRFTGTTYRPLRWVTNFSCKAPAESDLTNSSSVR